MGLTLAVVGPLQHDPDRLRATARDLLARPPFADEQPGPVTDVLLRLRSWIARLLDAVLGTVVGNHAVAWAVVALATTVVLVLVLRWGRRVGRETERVPSVDSATGRTAGDWLADAERHAEAGEWPAAIRCAYLALVARLVSDGLIDDGRGLTVGEIERLVARAAPQRSDDVAAAGRVFEDTWYGHRPADRHGYRRVVAAVAGDRSRAGT